METMTEAEIDALLSDIPDFDYEQMESSSFNEMKPAAEPKSKVKKVIQKKKIVKEKLPSKEYKIANPNLRLLLDVTLELSVELGRTNIQMKEILELGSGSILELNKSADEPISILVNERPIALGEVIVIDESFGVRITELLSFPQQNQLLP